MRSSVSQPEEQLPANIDTSLPISSTYAQIDRSRYQKWTAEKDNELARLVTTHSYGNVVDWECIANIAGRTEYACMERYYILQSRTQQIIADGLEYHAYSEVRPWHMPTEVSGGADISEPKRKVASVVQTMHELGCPIDWVVVASVVGTTELECLEFNTYNEGKGRWSYDKDTFTWDLPNRMYAFIGKHYPKPALPNYAAVSNYLWIAIEDCIDMHKLTKRPIKWTDVMLAKVAELHCQGVTNDEIARHLSPILTGTDVVNRFYRLQKSDAADSLTAQQKYAIRETANALVGRIPFTKILQAIHLKFPDIPQRLRRYHAISCLTCHKFYADKLKAPGVSDRVSRMVSSGVKHVQIAKELDVPGALISKFVSRMQSKNFEGSWTEEETSKLVEYAGSTKGRMDWKVCASFVGTKGPSQCINKWHCLKKKESQAEYTQEPI